MPKVIYIINSKELVKQEKTFYDKIVSFDKKNQEETLQAVRFEVEFIKMQQN